MESHKTKNGRWGLLTLSSCPLRTFGCTAKQPRWVYNFHVYRGTCRTCPRLVKIIKKAYETFGDSIKIRRGKWPGETLVFVSCPLRKTVGCRGQRWVNFHSVFYQKLKGACAPCRRYRGGTVDQNGYRKTRVLLRNGRTVYRFEHRCVMEKILDRKLRKGETVHHKNGKRADNRKRNLELRMSGNHPQGWSLRQMREYLKTVPKRLGGLK